VGGCVNGGAFSGGNAPAWFGGGGGGGQSLLMSCSHKYMYTPTL